MVKSDCDCSTVFLAGIIVVAVSGIQWIPSPLGLRLLGVWTASSSFAGLVWPNANTSKTLACSGARRFARSYIWTPGYLSRMAAQGRAAKNSKAKPLSKATSCVIALHLERITYRANSGVACVAWSAFLSRSGRFLALISVISPTTARLAAGSGSRTGWRSFVLPPEACCHSTEWNPDNWYIDYAPLWATRLRCWASCGCHVLTIIVLFPSQPVGGAFDVNDLNTIPAKRIHVLPSRMLDT